MIWSPGIAGRDITDGHTDFYARFVRPGVVVAGLDTDPQSYDYAVTRRHLSLLRQARDARGRKLEVVVLPGPERVRPEYEGHEMAAGYINFYVCNGAVIAPEFGDAKADRNARAAARAVSAARGGAAEYRRHRRRRWRHPLRDTAAAGLSAACERAQPVCSGMGAAGVPLVCH